MSTRGSKKRLKIRFIDDPLSNSEAEMDLDSLEDNNGDNGSDIVYELQYTDEEGASSSSEEICLIKPRQIHSGDHVVSLNSRNSGISNSSDSEQEDESIAYAESIPESTDNLPSFLTPQLDNTVDLAPLQNWQGTPVSEEQPWTHMQGEIPDFDFDVDSLGIQFDVNPQTSVEEIFDHVFSKDLMQYLVQCTNSYGTALSNLNKPSTRHSRNQKFRHTTVEEMKKFFGLSLLNGNIRIPNRKLFTFDDPLYYHPVFAHTMSCRRYAQILRCMCFSDLGTKGAENITKFCDMLTLNFRKIYKPDKELRLDEPLLLHRGRLHNLQCIKSNKTHGLKFYNLATTEGYVLNILMCSGKDENSQLTDIRDKKLEQLLLYLMTPFLLKGHHLFVSSCFNSISLAQKFLDFKTHTTGTLRVNRKDNPKEVVERTLTKGGHFWVRRNNVYVSKWVDKRPIITLTTRDHPRIINTRNKFGKMVKKPIEIATYDKYMSSVERSEQMVNYYSSPRKTIKWYKKVFFHLLDTAVWNSYYLYKQFVLKNPKYEFMAYRDELIKKLISLKEGCEGKDLALNLKKYNNRIHNNPQRNIMDPSKERKFWGHWPKREPAPENSKKKYSFLMCKLCTKNKKRVETSYRCIGCPGRPALCPECFPEYHRLLEQQDQVSRV